MALRIVVPIKFKGMRQYHTSTVLLSRSSISVLPCACFLTAICLISLAGFHQVMDPKDPKTNFDDVIQATDFRISKRALLPEIDNCEGKRIFMYAIPADYNILLQHPARCHHNLIPWMNLCPRFRNGGFGVELDSSEKAIQSATDGAEKFDYTDWYETDFYLLDMIFHIRMKEYGCLTENASLADAFYVPYYTGLLALDYLYDSAAGGTYEDRSRFGVDLITWMERNGGDSFKRYGAKDHFVVMGRTTWDFHLREKWSTGFSDLPHVANMTSLILESLPGYPGEQAIPYPTGFHPATPQRLEGWIQTVKSTKRRFLFSYVGAPRKDSLSVRAFMTASCFAAGKEVCDLVDCSKIKCSHDPIIVYNSFLQSNFCLQPRGDTPTRRSTFDCLISGAIPVFFHKDSAYSQYIWHLPKDPKSYSVFINEEDLKRGVSIEHLLRSYSRETVESMQRVIVDLIPNLLYFDCRSGGCGEMRRKDAFDLTVERVLERVAVRKKEFSEL